MFRVAQGKAWTSETASFVMTDRRSESQELGDLHFVSPQDGSSLTLSSSAKTIHNDIDVTEDVVVDTP